MFNKSKSVLRMINTDKSATLPLYNINSDQSKFKQIIRLIGLVCVCTTVYFTTDRILAHVEDSASLKVHPAQNVSILQETERVLVENTVPVEENTVPVENTTVSVENTSPIHPRHVGEVAGNNGVYTACCVEGGTYQPPHGFRCIGTELLREDLMMSEMELDIEVTCLRVNGVRVHSRHWSQDPLHRLIQEAAGPNCAGPYTPGMLGISTIVSSRSGASPWLLLPGEENHPVNNWVPNGMVLELYSGNVLTRRHWAEHGRPGTTITRIQVLNSPLSGSPFGKRHTCALDVSSVLEEEVCADVPGNAQEHAPTILRRDDAGA